MENQYSPPENVKNFKQNLDGKVENRKVGICAVSVFSTFRESVKLFDFS